jgi:DNA-binding MarR family transcriptional regulator
MKNLTEQVNTLGASLRLPYEALVQCVYTELAQHGFPDIRPSHGAVFRHVLPDGSRVTDLAGRARMTKQSMAYLVDYLHERGYVEFAPDPTDGRAKLVRLTGRGTRVLETLVAIGQRTEAELTNELGAEQMAILRALLERLRQGLERRHESTEPAAAGQGVASVKN